MRVDVHEVTDGDDDLLNLLRKLAGGGEDESLALLDLGVDVLENRDGEGSGLAGTGLGLSDNITTFVMSVDRAYPKGSDFLTLDNGHDSALLDSRRALETVGIDSFEN